MKKGVEVVGFSDREGVYFFRYDGEKHGEHTHELVKDGKEKFLRFSFVARHLRWLQGEILTIAEATITNDRQLKATKDVIRDAFNSKISWIYENCGMPEDEQDALDYSSSE